MSTQDATTADAPDGEAVLRLDGVRKSFGAETAVEDLSLSVRDGELLSLLGPSGCGKTTTLRLLAGLERPTEGTIEVAGNVVADGDSFVEPEERGVGLVFQDFALFPHLTVAENIAFGLEDADADQREGRVAELLELVGLAEFGDRTPDQLSGGQAQRVALARSLAPEPDVLLLDEPFSNLDVRLRVEMREEIRAILKEAGVTAVSVTHDQEEALSIGDRVAVMHDGQVEQVGTPTGVFQHPESRFVASFLGQAGFVSGFVAQEEVRTAIGPLGHEQLAGDVAAYEGARVDVLVRPDDLRAVPAGERTAGDAYPVSADGAGDGFAALDGDDHPGTAQDEPDGHIVHRQYSGPSFTYRVELSTGDVVHCLHNHDDEFRVGDAVDVVLEAGHSLAWYPAD